MTIRSIGSRTRPSSADLRCAATSACARRSPTAAAPSWSAVTSERISQVSTGFFAVAFPCGSWFNAPGTFLASSTVDSTREGRTRKPRCSCAVIFPGRLRSSAVFRARAALRDGMAIYLNGDIPWTGPNTCPGRLLGRPQRFLAIWTELAVLTSAPVFLVFCTHLPGGRFALEIEAIGHLHSGEEESAVADYLKQLEARIEASPADAVAHLAWPCYVSPPAPGHQPTRRRATASRS